MDIQWKSIQSDHHKRSECERTPVFHHPLQPFKSAKSNGIETQENDVETVEEVNKYEFVDPLGATNEDYWNDVQSIPLDSAVADLSVKRKTSVLYNTLESKPKDSEILDVEYPDFEPWRKKRQLILDSFSTSDRLSISSSFLPPSPKRVIVDKTQRRLEVLEDLSGLRKLSELSQSEFVSHLNELKELLVVAWHNNKRVEAVRLVIEVSRMLSTRNNPEFYPNQWVLVTDIIDLFGKLVFERLLNTANAERKLNGQSPLSAHFVSDDIPPGATEKAKNWFCKISDIKELIPRFYVESAIIGCLRFLDSGSIKINLLRLASMTNKFSSSLLASYARAYICKIAMILDPADRAPHWKCLNDWMQSLQPCNMDDSWPALEWVVQCVSYGQSTINDIAPLWEYCRQANKREFMIKAFVNGISTQYLTCHIFDVTSLVLEGIYGPTNIVALGRRLLTVEMPEDVRKNVFNEVWEKIVLNLSSSDFFPCAEVWIPFVCKHLSLLEMLKITETVTFNLTSKNRGSFLAEALKIALAIFEKTSIELRALLNSQPICNLLDLIRDEVQYSSQCAGAILRIFVANNGPDTVSDISFARQIIDQCGLIMSSVRPDSLHDEVEEQCRLICSTLGRINYSADHRRGLELLVNAREILVDWPIITSHLVKILSGLAMRCTFTLPDSAKKAYFIRACIANLYITIPSIDDPIILVRSALRVAQIALFANALPQADALMTLIAQIIPTIQDEFVLLSLTQEFLSVLVSTPSSPSKQFLHIYDLFIIDLERRTITNSMVLAEIFVICLRYLWSISQAKIYGKIVYVQTNDVLFGQSEEYLSCVEEHVCEAMNRLLALVEADNDISPFAAILLLEHITDNLEIQGPICVLVKNLIKRLSRSGKFNDRLSEVIENLRYRSVDNLELAKHMEKLGLLHETVQL